jgi:hypothetical protein
MEHREEELFGEELQGALLARNLFTITMAGAALFIFAAYFSAIG